MLTMRYGSNLGGEFREILILRKYQRNVIRFAIREG
jgi:hypothetical protein